MAQDIVRGKRILLVEDEEQVREAYNMLLRLDDHQVTEAGNGAEGLDLFGKGSFDLVITDFEMPTMKGNELAARIKSQAPGQPILMVTAYGVGPEVRADAILNKPFTLAELRAAIAKLVH